MNMGQVVLCPVVEDAVIVAAIELAESAATMSPRVFWLRTKQEYNADYQMTRQSTDPPEIVPN